LTTNGNMIAALQRLQQEQGLPPQDLPGELTAFGIGEQLKQGFSSLFSSHPPLEDRIRALQAGQPFAERTHLPCGEQRQAYFLAVGLTTTV
jgi:Zn-dependent protease with chaperone function